MKFRGQTCVYCQAEKSTPSGDHVFARGFFLEARRANLPKVPACTKCGDEKSRLERYLMEILPFGGRHADALENLITHAPRRLAKNQKLLRQLSAGQSPILMKGPSGLLVPTTTLQIDSGKIKELFEFIVKGLMWYHWGALLGPDDFVEVHLPNEKVEAAFARMAALRAKESVTGAPGDGTFNYNGQLGTANISVWEFSIYGGVRLTGGADEDEVISKVRAMTGPRRVQRNAERELKAAGKILLGR